LVNIRAAIGARDGPTVSALGVQHGDEYSGMEIVNRLFYGGDWTFHCGKID
jgi:predicted deacylase